MKNDKFTIELSIKANVPIVTKEAKATFLPKTPEAIGLTFFCGCNLSLSRSSTSFNKYIEELARVKATKATIKSEKIEKTFSYSSQDQASLTENKKGKNTKRLLVH